MVRTPLSLPRFWGRSLGGKLKSHTVHSMAKTLLIKKMSSGQAPRGPQPAPLDVATRGDHLASSQKPVTTRSRKSFSLPGNSPANEKPPRFRPGASRGLFTAAPPTSVSCERAASPLSFTTVSDLKHNAVLFLNKPILLVKSWLFSCFRSLHPRFSPCSAQAARVFSKKAEASCTALLSSWVPSIAPTVHSQHWTLSSIHLQTLPTS